VEWSRAINLLKKGEENDILRLDLDRLYPHRGEKTTVKGKKEEE